MATWRFRAPARWPTGTASKYSGGYHKNEAGVKIYPKEVKRFGTVLERWSTLE